MSCRLMYAKPLHKPIMTYLLLMGPVGPNVNWIIIKLANFFRLQNVGHFVQSSMCERIFVNSRERYANALQKHHGRHVYSYVSHKIDIYDIMLY